MKPDWDKLMSEWNSDAEKARKSLIADVDCTAKGAKLCEQVGVRGYPTIKWGNPDQLEDYKGPRDYDGLFEWASSNLVEACTPENQEPCSEETKVEIARLQKLSVEELQAQVDARNKEIDALEDEFDEYRTKVKADYEKMLMDKSNKVKGMKDTTVKTMKQVIAYLKGEKIKQKLEM